MLFPYKVCPCYLALEDLFLEINHIVLPAESEKKMGRLINHIWVRKNQVECVEVLSCRSMIDKPYLSKKKSSRVR